VYKVTLLFIFIPLVLFSQTSNDKIELMALRKSKNYSKSYRVLKTTISNKSFFQSKYLDTDMTLDYVLRYHFYTAIDLNAKTNQLISMDGTKFNLSSKNAKELQMN